MKIGVSFQQPFNTFSALLEKPCDPSMIYSSDVDGAQLILRQFKQKASDAIESEFQAVHEKIIHLGKSL